jgi:predicted ribosome quality control (RQC) complex YloA/Tae2 family protein
MKKPENLKLYTYELPGGWTVIAGRTDADNERLSIKLADPRDWWFHVRGMPGSHVLLKYDPAQAAEPGTPTLKAAAAVAAWHSKARSGGVVPVSCTRACNVSKPRGAHAGTVSIRKERVFKVRPAIPEQHNNED